MTHGARPFTPAEAKTFSDEYVDVNVLSSETVFTGHVWDIVRDTITLPGSDRPIVRDIVKHPGAVAVIALNDKGQILLIQQYRHPLRVREWEVPAGLLDVADESPHVAAARELAEETDLQAHTWHTLADQLSTPGGNCEALRIYLARDLTELPAAHREDEEEGIVPRWVDLEDAFHAILDGRVTNATAAIAILHLHARAQQNFAGLRPVDAPWPTREHLLTGVLATPPSNLQK